MSGESPTPRPVIAFTSRQVTPKPRRPLNYIREKLKSLAEIAAEEAAREASVTPAPDFDELQPNDFSV